jgi:pimeloyl-ACP methyl ester carboxylesterase
LLKLDLREALANVKAKTLILGASFPDEKVVTATFEKQYAKLPVRTLAIAPESKHFIMFDQPQWFYDQVNSFLAQ